MIPKIERAAHHDDLDIQLGFAIDGIEQSEKDEAQSCTQLSSLCVLQLHASLVHTAIPRKSWAEVS